MAITSRVTKRISSPVTKRNPRPRKYASQAERQAAYRARNVMLEFRAEPKTADNITRISETLGYPRSDVLLSMVKFALTNHDWARFGLTHKTIPTYKENPMESWVIVNKETGEAVLETYNKAILSKLNTEKYEAIPALKYLVALNRKIKENPTMKPASPAQLAARKRFAEMARSGAFKKKATKRKANPTKSNATILSHMLDLIAEGVTYNEKALKEALLHPGITAEDKVVIKAALKGAPYSHTDLMQAANDIRNYESRKTNPAKKTVSQKISQLRHEGYPQRQAVAVALSEQRAGKVKRNPAKTQDIYFVSIMNQDGLEYGVDRRTPVTYTFSAKEPKKAYRTFGLPFNVTSNPKFQEFAKRNKTIVASLNEIIEMMQGFAK